MEGIANWPLVASGEVIALLPVSGLLSCEVCMSLCCCLNIVKQVPYPFWCRAHVWTKQLNFHLLFVVYIAGKSIWNEQGWLLCRRTTVSGHRTGTFVSQTAFSSLGSATIKCKKHILFSLAFRCVKLSLTVCSGIYSRRKLPFPVSLGAKLDVW